MAYDTKEKQAAAARIHYLENKEKMKARAARFTAQQRILLREIVRKYLLDHPCVVCGENDIVVLDFDHRNPAEKSRNVTDCVRMGVSTKTLWDEIKKCDIRCSNCHRRRTASQRWARSETVLKKEERNPQLLFF